VKNRKVVLLCGLSLLKT